jgi:hypothetical protein
VILRNIRLLRIILKLVIPVRRGKPKSNIINSRALHLR